MQMKLKRVKDTKGNSLLEAVVKFEKRCKLSFMPPPPELVPKKKENNSSKKNDIPPRAFQ